jgi:phospholipase C
MGTSGEINTAVKTDVPAPIGLGFRVPLLVVSPWTRGNIVVSETFDHTSVLKFLEIKFNVEISTISPWRRAVTGNLMSFFDFESEPDYSWPILPDTSNYRRESAEDCKLPYPEIPIDQTYPQQEPGTRISRALDYTFLTGDVLSNNGLLLNITNKGLNGGAFLLVDNILLTSTDSNDAIKQYAIDGVGDGNDNTIIDDLMLDSGDVEDYNYLLLGANGFARGFSGNTKCSNIDTQLIYDDVSSLITLIISNINQDSIVVNINNNVYSSYYDMELSSTVANNGILKESFDVSKGGNWYDFTINIANCDYTRRFAGHLEIRNTDSISDPAMGYLTGAINKIHPVLPTKFSRLFKKNGANMTTAEGNKDAIWIPSEL